MRLFQRLLLVFVVVLASTRLSAQSTGEPTRYLRSFVNSIGWANEAINAIDSASKVTDATKDIEFLYANKRAKDFYQRAASELSPFQESHMDLIAQSAKAGVFVFQKYGGMVDESVAIQRDVNQTLAALKRGEQVDVDAKMAEVNEKTAELRFRGDKLGEALGAAATAAAWIAYVIHENGEPEYPLRYAISASDRKELLSDLTSTFGKTITKGPSTDQTYVQVAAAVLYKTLTQGEGKQQKAPKK